MHNFVLSSARICCLVAAASVVAADDDVWSTGGAAQAWLCLYQRCILILVPDGGEMRCVSSRIASMRTPSPVRRAAARSHT
jgi:hypothetical protein